MDLAGSRWTLFAGTDVRRWRAASPGMDVRVHELGTMDDAALVRPDGFVAWRGATEESLQAALRGLGRS